MLGSHKQLIQDWIRKMRASGGIINGRIVMAAAEGIINKIDRSSATKYGTWHDLHHQKFGLLSAKEDAYMRSRMPTWRVWRLPWNYKAFRKSVWSTLTRQAAMQLLPGGQKTMEEQGSR